MQFSVALAIVAGLGEDRMPWAWDRVEPSRIEAPADLFRHSAPASWLQADPADSLYKAAREALNRRDLSSGGQPLCPHSFPLPKSGYAADALYWQAFALYRLGSNRDLKEALAALRQQQARFPKAATHGDAAALVRRVQGELARRGDQVPRQP